MPRRSKDERTYVVLSPTTINRENTSISTSFVYSPSRSVSRETSTDTKIAPQKIVNKNYAFKSDYDYSPSVSRDIDYEYEPINRNSQSYRTKYAPSFKAKASLTYAPETHDSLTYRPQLKSVFKPQPILVSNYQALKDYYAYIIQLLSLLR